jgi:hypothetical protein
MRQMRFITEFVTETLWEKGSDCSYSKSSEQGVPAIVDEVFEAVLSNVK